MEVDHSIQEVSHVIQDIDTFEEWFVDIDKIEMAGDHPGGGIAVYMVIYIVSTALSLPGAALLTLLAGALFGVVTGTIISTIPAVFFIGS